MFGELDFFSLSTAERNRYYPVGRVKRESFVVPNYPLRMLYEKFQRPRRLALEPVIKLLYQGSMGPEHAFEETIQSLGTPVAGKGVQLVLKGSIRENYRRELMALAERSGVGERLVFTGFVPYPKLPEEGADCAIGLAVYTGKGIGYQTAVGGNKIYEYIGVGLPVILLDTPYFRKHFGSRKWAFFADLTESSLRRAVETIVSCYEEAANAAIEDFKREFTYEQAFLPALGRVVEALAQFRHDGSQ